MKTFKKALCSLLFALALMLGISLVPHPAKADQEYPSCNLADSFSAYDGMDTEGNYIYTDSTLNGQECTDPDPIGGIGC